jgi:hypothetical protein
MRKLLIVIIIILVGIQFVPVERTNPPVTHQVKWDSPKTYDYAKRACYDCHSNETVWPWYSKVAPVSWLVAHDVEEGRRHLNFSTGKLDDAHESAEEVSEGKMPLDKYVFLHSEAAFSEQEKQEFIDGLKRTFDK